MFKTLLNQTFLKSFSKLYLEKKQHQRFQTLTFRSSMSSHYYLCQNALLSARCASTGYYSLPGDSHLNAHQLKTDTVNSGDTTSMEPCEPPKRTKQTPTYRCGKISKITEGKKSQVLYSRVCLLNLCLRVRYIFILITVEIGSSGCSEKKK